MIISQDAKIKFLAMPRNIRVKLVSGLEEAVKASGFSPSLLDDLRFFNSLPESFFEQTRYAAAGYPLGKKLRGLKKWRKINNHE